jgi:hypothetical protein
MFPAFRFIVAGFFAGFFIVAGWLSLTAHTRLFRTDHSALIERADQGEWRHLLLRSALRRADELNRLRDLPDTPVVQPTPPAPEAAPAVEPAPASAAAPEAAAPPPVPQIKTAVLPATPEDAVPEDATNTVVQTPSAAVPVDIGETSSTELPVEAHPAAVKPEPPYVKPATAVRGATKAARKPRKRRPKTQTASTNGQNGTYQQQPWPFLFFFDARKTQSGFTSKTNNGSFGVTSSRQSRSRTNTFASQQDPFAAAPLPGSASSVPASEP